MTESKAKAFRLFLASPFSSAVLEPDLEEKYICELDFIGICFLLFVI